MFESGLELPTILGSDGSAPMFSFRVNVTDVDDASLFITDEVGARARVRARATARARARVRIGFRVRI